MRIGQGSVPGPVPGPTAAIRVLLVDEHRRFAALIAALIAAGPVDAELEVVETLTAAIAALEVQPADCVLLDLDLPDAEPDETIRRMASVAGPTPLFVLSGNADPGIADRVRRAGALDFIDKGDLNGPVLLQLLAHVASRSRSGVTPVDGTSRPPRMVEQAPIVAAATAGLGVLVVFGWIVDAPGCCRGERCRRPRSASLWPCSPLRSRWRSSTVRQPLRRRARSSHRPCRMLGPAHVPGMGAWPLTRYRRTAGQRPGDGRRSGPRSPHTAAALALLAGALITLDARRARVRPRISSGRRVLGRCGAGGARLDVRRRGVDRALAACRAWRCRHWSRCSPCWPGCSASVPTRGPRPCSAATRPRRR